LLQGIFNERHETEQRTIEAEAAIFAYCHPGIGEKNISPWSFIHPK
jgi:hypothetical protein